MITDVRICCCGSRLPAFEKFLNGKSIGFFCLECETWRMKNFTITEPNDSEPIKNDI